MGNIDSFCTVLYVSVVVNYIVWLKQEKVTRKATGLLIFLYLGFELRIEGVLLALCADGVTSANRETLPSNVSTTTTTTTLQPLSASGIYIINLLIYSKPVLCRLSGLLSCCVAV